MEMEGDWSQNNAADPDNNYLYNGKELDKDFGLDWYHYGARMYDAQIGRFTGVDPISDQFPHLSTFNYASNDPIKNIDLHGLQGIRYDHDLDPAKQKRNPNNTGNKRSLAKDIVTVVKNAANFVYDKVIGNDDLGNANTAIELATEGKSGVMEAASKISKTLGPVMTVAEGVKIVNEGSNATTEAEKNKAGQDAAKFGTEIGLGVLGGPAIGIPANILIRNSRDQESIANPANLDKLSGSFETSRNAVLNHVNARAKQRQLDTQKSEANMTTEQKRIRNLRSSNNSYQKSLRGGN